MKGKAVILIHQPHPIIDGGVLEILIKWTERMFGEALNSVNGTPNCFTNTNMTKNCNILL